MLGPAGLELFDVDDVQESWIGCKDGDHVDPFTVVDSTAMGLAQARATFRSAVRA
jgi:hypothetical protein